MITSVQNVTGMPLQLHEIFGLCMLVVSRHETSSWMTDECCCDCVICAFVSSSSIISYEEALALVDYGSKYSSTLQIYSTGFLKLRNGFII